MNNSQVLKIGLKYWEILIEYLETLELGYIGAGIFVILFALFIYESMASSQISVKFLLIIFVFMIAVYYFGNIMFSGMNPAKLNN